jgi:hypothetical protein
MQMRTATSTHSYRGTGTEETRGPSKLLARIAIGVTVAGLPIHVIGKLHRAKFRRVLREFFEKRVKIVSRAGGKRYVRLHSVQTKGGWFSDNIKVGASLVQEVPPPIDFESLDKPSRPLTHRNLMAAGSIAVFVFSSAKPFNQQVESFLAFLQQDDEDGSLAVEPCQPLADAPTSPGTVAV